MQSQDPNGGTGGASGGGGHEGTSSLDAYNNAPDSYAGDHPTPLLPSYEVKVDSDTEAVLLGMAIGTAGALNPVGGDLYTKEALDYARENFGDQYYAFLYGVVTGAGATGIAAAASVGPTAAGGVATCAPSAGGGCVAAAATLTYEAAVVVTAARIELMAMAATRAPPRAESKAADDGHGNSTNSNRPQPEPPRQFVSSAARSTNSEVRLPLAS